ncbi:MAG TPA: YceI family protein, partial [Labilithrix sp.]
AANSHVGGMQTTTQDSTKQNVTRETSWTLDPSHTNATFSVRHMMVSNVRGEFQKLSGSVKGDLAKPESLSIEATIDVGSINTREPKRDAHLRSADFFDVEKYPSITFVSKRARRTGDGLEVAGELTIHGTTREVVLEVEGPTPEHKDPWGNVRIGASAKTKIKRSDFGMTWNAALEAGGILVGDEIKIELDLELIKAAT